MKYLKILGLAVVAAAALMAFAGAGTASADELCTEPADATNMCPAGKKITTITATQLTNTGRLKTTGGATVATCTGAHIAIELPDPFNGNANNTTGASPILGSVENLEFSGCDTTVDVVANGTGRAEAGAGGGTTLTSIGGQVTLQLFGVSCTYGTTTGVDLGEVSTSGAIDFSKGVTKTAGGGLCPATATWEGSFQVTNHTAVHYISN